MAEGQSLSGLAAEGIHLKMHTTPMLTTLVALAISMAAIADNPTTSPRDRILAGLDSDDPQPLLEYVENLTCVQLLRAGISSERLNVEESDAGPVLRAIDHRLESGECHDYGYKPDVVGETVMNDDGSFCFECYSEYNKRLVNWLDELKKTQERYETLDSPSEALERTEDFRVSSTGMLIHEECFAPDRFQFDVERAVVDALVTTFTKFIDLERIAVEKLDRERTAISAQHIPAFVDLYDATNWVKSKSLRYEYRTGRGELIEGNQNSTDPCSDLRDFTMRYQIDMKEDCSFATNVERGRPKLFCEAGEVESIATELESINAYGSNPTKPRPLKKKKYQAKSFAYLEPYIVFNYGRNFTSSRFQSTFIHEHFHNFGWEDFSQSHNSYSYFCQVTVFYEDSHSDVLSTDHLEGAVYGCIDTGYDSRSVLRASGIQGRIVGDSD